MAYIPFIYFTSLLIWHINRRDMRFGAGAMSLLCVDISAFFSIILDVRNLYGDFGCNPYSLTIGGVLLYCTLWTVVLYPIMRLDKKDIRMEMNKSMLFSFLCVFFIVCGIIYIVGTGFIGKVIENLTITRSAAYDNAMSNSTIYKGQRRFWLWIPQIVSNASPLCLLLWFISETISQQRLWIRLGLLGLSVFVMLNAYAGGGRAQLIWYVEIFMILFAYFAPMMSRRKKIIILGTGSVVGLIALIGLLIITLSRFETSVMGYALNSIVGYAGQNLNNFCACLPYIDAGHIYSDRMFPLLIFLTNGMPYDMFEYYSFLGIQYPIQVNVFFTMFGGVLMDLGIVGLLVYLMFYLGIARYLAAPKNNILQTPQMLMFAIVVCVPVRGLYGYPFTTIDGTLYLLFVFALYTFFYYTFKFGRKQIV